MTFELGHSVTYDARAQFPVACHDRYANYIPLDLFMQQTKNIEIYSLGVGPMRQDSCLMGHSGAGIGYTTDADKK